MRPEVAPARSRPRRPGSNSAIAGRNSPAPTSATGPGMAVSLPGLLRTPVEGCDTGPMTSRQRWTLVATIIGSGAVFLDGTIVNVALKQIGQELPATVVGVLEGQTYVVSGYLAVLAALLILSGAPGRPLRPAARLRDRAGRVRGDLGAVRPRADARVAGRLPARSRVPPARCSSPGRSRSSPTPSRAWRAAARSASGRPRPSALTVLGPVVGGLLVDTAGWRVAFLDQRPAPGGRAVGDASATSPSRATRRRPAGSTGSARSSLRSPSAASRSG